MLSGIGPLFLASWLAILVVLAPYASAQIGQSLAQQVLNEGVEAYKAGDFEKAIERFRWALDLDPKLLEAQLYLGSAYASRFIPGHPSEENKRLGETAIREFEKVLEQDPEHTMALSHLATIHLAMKNFDQAKKYRHKLIKLDPEDPENYYAIGVISWGHAYRNRMELKQKYGLEREAPLAPVDRSELAEKNRALVNEGIDMLHEALALKPKYIDAIAYLHLMYREKAELASGWQEREKWLQQADELLEQLKQLRDELSESRTPK